MTMKNKKQENLATERFNIARVGLGAGALALFASTAYMNVSGWVAQASDASQALANGLLAGGFELMALFGLTWAGYQYAAGRKAAASVAAAIAVTAIIFNTFAAQNFLHLQSDGLANAIETSAANLSVVESEIDALNRQIDSLITENGGTIPRPIEAIKGQYSHLNPSENPINMGRRDSEIALREEYNRLQGRVLELKRDAAADTVAANDQARTVIPTAMLGPFVWLLEIIKGTAFFALGNTSPDAKQKRVEHEQNRRRWAIIRAKQQKPHIS